MHNLFSIVLVAEIFEKNIIVCLFHVYPPVTRKRWWRYIFFRIRTHLGVVHSEFSSCLTFYHWICCLFEATKQR